MEFGEHFNFLHVQGVLYEFRCGRSNFKNKTKKTPGFFETTPFWVGSGFVLFCLKSKVVFRTFFEIPLIDTGTTREPRQINPILYFIQDINESLSALTVGNIVSKKQ